MIVYLSGPIENAQNNGADWRVMMTEWLKAELNHKVFDPVIETKTIITVSYTHLTLPTNREV